MRDANPNGGQTMKRRWIIRSFFIGLLTLCVAAWGWSYYYEHLVFLKHGSNSLGLGQSNGTWIAAWATYSGGHEGLNFETSRNTDDLSEWLGRQSMVYSFLGFFISKDRSSSTQLFVVGVPFWFLTILAAVSLFFVWHKTRPKPNPATAFPVETDKTKL